MGCDIHSYVEFKEGERWKCFRKIDLPRCYPMFGAMAGVRSDRSHIEPRGVPKDITWITADDYTVYVSDEIKEKGFCRKSDSDRWIERGLSTVWDENRVTDPDAHTPSWLSVEDYRNALHCAGINVGQEYTAMLALMEVLTDARIVFWFDN